jgi:hypothetical protein
MSDKRTTTEDVLGDFGFRMVWSVSDLWADVTAYEITGRGMEENAPLFERKGATCGPDHVESHEDAEEYLDGYVKWDGCTELDMGRPHWCGPYGYKKHCALLRYIYERAFQLMGREPDDAWIDEANV